MDLVIDMFGRPNYIENNSKIFAFSFLEDMDKQYIEPIFYKKLLYHDNHMLPFLIVYINENRTVIKSYINEECITTDNKNICLLKQFENNTNDIFRKDELITIFRIMIILKQIDKIDSLLILMKNTDDDYFMEYFRNVVLQPYDMSFVIERYKKLN